MPAFLVGWTHGEPPPPGYVAAWFDEAYGGPLRIRFLASTGHHHFEAAHTNWMAEVNIAIDTELSPCDREIGRGARTRITVVSPPR